MMSMHVPEAQQYSPALKIEKPSLCTVEEVKMLRGQLEIMNKEVNKIIWPTTASPKSLHHSELSRDTPTKKRVSKPVGPFRSVSESCCTIGGHTNYCNTPHIGPHPHLHNHMHVCCQHPPVCHRPRCHCEQQWNGCCRDKEAWYEKPWPRVHRDPSTGKRCKLSWTGTGGCPICSRWSMNYINPFDHCRLNCSRSYNDSRYRPNETGTELSLDESEDEDTSKVAQAYVTWGGKSLDKTTSYQQKPMSKDLPLRQLVTDMLQNPTITEQDQDSAVTSNTRKQKSSASCDTLVDSGVIDQSSVNSAEEQELPIASSRVIIHSTDDQDSSTSQPVAASKPPDQPTTSSQKESNSFGPSKNRRFIKTPPSYMTIHEPDGRFTGKFLKWAYKRSTSPGNFATLLARHMFTDEERLDKNCNGFGRASLDSVRLGVIRDAVFAFCEKYGLQDKVRAWRESERCIDASTRSIRRALSRLRRKS